MGRTKKEAVEATTVATETAVATVPKAEVTTFNALDAMKNMAGAGQENIGVDDIQIPFISIAEGLSPSVKKSNAGYIEGCSVGDITIALTKQYFDGQKGINVIPIGFNKKFIEWLPNRGGLVAIHDPEQGKKLLATCEADEKNNMLLPNGNTLTETNQHYVMFETPNGWQQAVIAMSRTRLKASRTWNTLLKTFKVKAGSSEFNPPAFATIYNLSTVQETSKVGGHEFNNWSISRLKDHPDLASMEDSKNNPSLVPTLLKTERLFQEASELHQLLVGGNLDSELEKSLRAESEEISQTIRENQDVQDLADKTAEDVM